jgi:hypothetical protein
MISMISTRSALSCAPAPYLVYILSFAYSQSAYWLNNNLLCCNGCVDPLGCSLSDPVLKLMINYLLSLYLYVLLFTSCSVTYMLPPWDTYFSLFCDICDNTFGTNVLPQNYTSLSVWFLENQKNLYLS